MLEKWFEDLRNQIVSDAFETKKSSEISDCFYEINERVFISKNYKKLSKKKKQNIANSKVLNTPRRMPQFYKE